MNKIAQEYAEAMMQICQLTEQNIDLRKLCEEQHTLLLELQSTLSIILDDITTALNEWKPDGSRALADEEIKIKEIISAFNEWKKNNDR